MKIVCDTCGTKYSVDDSRVAGKAFKIRCKKCSREILLRGAPAPVTEPVPEAGAWHVVQGGTQVGPIALAELHQLRATGKLDDESLIWREGFADWRALGTVDELRDSTRVSVEIAPEVTDAPAPAPAPARPALRNERNETSVLFTLGNLAKLAASAPAVASPSTGSEGSGLLDIRSLARTLAPAPTRTRTERGSIDDLPVYGPVSFAEPVVMVPGVKRTQDRRLVWALAASASTLAIVAAILVVIVVRDNAAPAHAAGLPAAVHATVTPAATSVAQAAPAAAPSVTQAAPTAAAATSTTHAAPNAAAATSTAQAAPTATAATSTAHAAPATTPSAHTTSAASRRAPQRTSSPTPSTPRVEPTTALTLQPKRTPDSCTEVSCLVSNYADKCCEIYRKPAAGNEVTTAPASSLPDSLDRAAITAGLTHIDTSGCRDKSPAHGDVKVSIKVSSAGAVTAVNVKSSPAEELSACVTAAAQKGTFAKTQRGGSFAYVWRF